MGKLALHAGTLGLSIPTSRPAVYHPLTRSLRIFCAVERQPAVPELPEVISDHLHDERLTEDKAWQEIGGGEIFIFPICEAIAHGND